MNIGYRLFSQVKLQNFFTLLYYLFRIVFCIICIIPFFYSFVPSFGETAIFSAFHVEFGWIWISMALHGSTMKSVLNFGGYLYTTKRIISDFTYFI